MMSIVIPGEPVGKGRPRMTRQGHAYTPEKTASYENLVKLEFERCFPGFEPYGKEVPLAVTITAKFAPPASASMKKRSDMLMGRLWPTKTPDADNIAKAILDALHGVCYINDASVVMLSVEKKYAQHPGVIVDIEEVGPCS